MDEQGRKARPTTADQRRHLIAERVITAGSAPIQELADTFGVSVMTIHRDLDDLQARGILRKSRGAATAAPSGVFEPSIHYRLRINASEKSDIARHAATLIEPGMAVMLDDSTTALELIPHLPALAPLQVATNSLEAMNRLKQAPGIGLIGLGGDYDLQHDSFLGVNCVEAVQSLVVDAAFVSTSAVTGGFAYHQEGGIVAVKRAMLAAARRRYLLVDHTKLTRIALHRVCPLSDFDLVVTDAAAPADAVDALRQQGVEVVIVGPGP